MHTDGTDEALKRRARSAVRDAVAAGKLVRPNACSSCGADGRIEGHHQDYSQPLVVVWLCVDCHSSRHVDLRAPTSPEARAVLVALADAEAEYRVAAADRDATRSERDALVASALRDGWSHARIAEATGLTRGRIGQFASRSKGPAS